MLTRAMLAVCLAGFYFSAFSAFKVEPPQVVLKVNEGQRTAWIELVHTKGGVTPVELVVYERHVDLDGALVRANLKESKDFVVHPPRSVLRPGDRKRVQIMLKGKGAVTSDRTYMIHAKEVALPIEEEGAPAVRTGLNMVMNYYIVLALETGRPGKLTFVSSKTLDSGRVELIVENKSAGRVTTGKMHIMAGKKKITEFTGNNEAIMPGSKRRFVFKHDKALTAKEVKFGKD